MDFSEFETQPDLLQQSGQDVLQVSQLNTKAKKLLEGEFHQLWVEGEISNLARPQSGHIYLTLKDSTAQVRAAFFKQSQRGHQLELKNGQQVLVKAKVSLYAPRGDYQLIISKIQAAGAGQLQQAFEALKEKLQREGLFAPELKQQIPTMPGKIGVVTSASGAALQDILHILERRFPIASLIIYPTLVQGTSAAPCIAKMIDTANQRNEVDVLLVGRGGGSLEDLWPFNEEIVARSIARSQLPIISAVGHQTDFTIADFVADVRAPTPSAAAELATPDWQELFALFLGFQQSLTSGINTLVTGKINALEALARHIRHPQNEIQEHMQRLDQLTQRLHQSFSRYQISQQRQIEQFRLRLKPQNLQLKLTHANKVISQLSTLLHKNQLHLITQKRQSIEHLGRRLMGISPEKTLERGYVIAQNDQGNVIDKASKTEHNQHIQLRFVDGDIQVKVI